MKCTHCGAEMMLKQEHCPRCGQKAVFDFDVLAQSVHEDAAIRRGEQVDAWLRWFILLLLIAGAFLYGFNSLFDRPLVFDGAAVPALPVQEVISVGETQAVAPYVDPRPNPPISGNTYRVFAYRREPMRSRLRNANGGQKRDAGSRATATAVQEGLNWVHNAQLNDGSWPVNIMPDRWDQWQTKDFQWLKVGVSSLALLSFFGEGETWLPDEKSNAKSKYADRILKGVKWLMSQQDKETGHFGPSADSSDRSMFNHLLFNHGLATLAMAEAAGLSGDPYVKDSAQRGIDHILATQTPEGGWNFLSKKDGDSEVPLSSWNIQALYAAKEAGLTVPDNAMKRALEFYRKSTIIEKAGVRVSWSIKNDDKLQRDSLLAVALTVRQLLGEDPRANDMQQIIARLQNNAPFSKKEWGMGWVPASNRSDDDGRAKFDPYYNYFATQGMFCRGGKDWESWNNVISKSIPDMQDNDGCWRLNDVFTKQAGFVYSTALSILALQSYYRIQ